MRLLNPVPGQTDALNTCQLSGRHWVTHANDTVVAEVRGRAVIGMNGDLLVGQNAKRQAVVNPTNTFFSVNRFIGRKMNEVDEEAKQVLYQVIRDPNGNVKLECLAIGKTFAAEEISAQVLRKLVDDASKFLNDKVTKAVVTVPAYFNDAQRTATKDAGRIAGVDVLRIINEPTATSLAYGFDRKANETIFVFDLGGGTFNVSVLEVGDGVFEVLSTAGDTHLGGDDFDKQRIVDWLAQDFKKTEGVDLLKDKQALQRLTETAEKTKMELSSLFQASIRYPLLRKGEEEFVYESCTGLSAKKGSLDGDFTFYRGRVSALKGDSFLVAVARFPLEVPQYIY